MTDSFSLDCRDCPRLAAFLDQVRRDHPGYHALPVPVFGDAAAEFLIVGLAPGMHGANRTGRPFTGDHAGILLYRTLHQFGFASRAISEAADDALVLKNCRISNAVKCLPPQNKPLPEEIRCCNRYLAAELRLRPPRVILALGSVAHQAVLMACGLKRSSCKFGHHAVHALPPTSASPQGIRLYDSYHCSRYNTQTKRLTEAMFHEVFSDIAAELEAAVTAPAESAPVFDAQALMSSLPHLPGVYRMLSAKGDVLYVGKARDLKKRVSSYFQKTAQSPRIELMLSQVAAVETTATRSEGEALILENNLIKSLAPRYNILFRDDKSYPYLMLSGHAYPRLGFHRGPLDGKHRYFGPFPHTGAVRESIQLLQKIFRLRTCEDSVFQNRSRPCLLHQIRRCSAPCVGLIDGASYAADVKNAELFLQGREDDVLQALGQKMQQAADLQHYEQAAFYRDQIQALSTTQQKQYAESSTGGDADVIACAGENGAACVNLVMVRQGRHLGDKSFFPHNAEGRTAPEVLQAFLAQHYVNRPVPAVIVAGAEFDPQEIESVLSEQAGHPVQLVTRAQGQRRAWLEMAQKNAQLALAQRLSHASNQEVRLAALREALRLPDSVQRIECFDISHTQGEATVASCVVYDRFDMRNSEYRRYNIAGIQAGDDYAAMRSVLQRRYEKISRGEGVVPDLILIDGGKGQVGVARDVLAELGMNDIFLFGVAKGEERKPGLEQLICADAKTSIQLARDNPGLHLIQAIRDEAHRFAITGHRARRGKARVTSSLEGISGIGAKRRRELLARFGGLKGVLGASIDDLAQVHGISRKLAEKIYRELH